MVFLSDGTYKIATSDGWTLAVAGDKVVAEMNGIHLWQVQHLEKNNYALISKTGDIGIELILTALDENHVGLKIRDNNQRARPQPLIDSQKWEIVYKSPLGVGEDDSSSSGERIASPSLGILSEKYKNAHLALDPAPSGPPLPYRDVSLQNLTPSTVEKYNFRWVLQLTPPEK